MKSIWYALLLIASIYTLNHSFGKLPPLGPLFSPASGFWQQAKENNRTEETLNFPQLEAPVQVVFDKHNIPHIFAQTPTDAYFAQGYLTARDRLWQMDMTTRHAAGRLAEVLGPQLIESDRQQRRLGLLLAAERSIQAWKKSKEYYLLEAYTQGVNTYIQQLRPADYPLEYKLMQFAPETWSPLHTALILKSMEQTLCFGNNDLPASNALHWLGRDSFNLIYPEYNPKESPVIPPGTAFAKYSPPPAHYGNIPALQKMLPPSSLPQPPEFIGSNNWAINGSKSASGHPLLCNDPHLRLTLPSIWYQLQIHTPQSNVYGVSLPGMPGIIIGFNTHIAWGVTNVGQDVLDWYKIQWTDDTKEAYIIDGHVQKVQKIVEVIRVKGQAPIYDTVRYTSWGPVVYEDPENKYADLALHWIALQTPPPEQMSTFLRINRATDYQSFKNALRTHTSPPQNFAFASTQGNIALIVTGHFPIRQTEQGRFIQDGSNSQNAWQDFIPFEALPQTFNPKRGFVSSANQRSTDLTYPYYYTGRFADYRGRYINRSLQKMQQATIEDMQKLQCSTYSLQAEENLSALIKHLTTSALSPIQHQILDSLLAWDYQFDAHKKAPALYEKWWRNFYRLSWDEWLSLSDSIPVLMPEGWRTIALLDSLPSANFWDIQSTPQRETAEDVVLTAFRQMCADLEKAFTRPDFNWANYRSMNIDHLGQLAAFGHQNLQIGGHPTAPKAIRNGFGPSWRMVVELSSPPQAYGIYPGGQSGNPGSTHYDDLLTPWLQDQYFKLPFFLSLEDARQQLHLK